MAGETVLNLFVSSPGDVQAERERVDFVVERLNAEFAGRARIRTIRWETRYYSSHETFQTQIPEAAACDLVVAIFGAQARLAAAGAISAHADGRALPQRNRLRSLERDRGAARGPRRTRYLRLSPAARAARRPGCERPRRNRSAVAPADRFFRKVVPHPLRRIPRRVPGILHHRRIRRQGRGLPAPMAGAARLRRQGRGVGPRAPRLAVPRPGGLRRDPPKRVLRPRRRHRPGDPPPARTRGAARRGASRALPAHHRRQRLGQIVAAARRPRAAPRPARRLSRNRPVAPGADDPRRRPVPFPRRKPARRRGARAGAGARAVSRRRTARQAIGGRSRRGRRAAARRARKGRARAPGGGEIRGAASGAPAPRRRPGRTVADRDRGRARPALLRAAFGPRPPSRRDDRHSAALATPTRVSSRSTRWSPCATPARPSICCRRRRASSRT